MFWLKIVKKRPTWELVLQLIEADDTTTMGHFLMGFQVKSDQVIYDFFFRVNSSRSVTDLVSDWSVPAASAWSRKLLLGSVPSWRRRYRPQTPFFAMARRRILFPPSWNWLLLLFHGGWLHPSFRNPHLPIAQSSPSFPSGLFLVAGLFTTGARKWRICVFPPLVFLVIHNFI